MTPQQEGLIVMMVLAALCVLTLVAAIGFSEFLSRGRPARRALMAMGIVTLCAIIAITVYARLETWKPVQKIVPADLPAEQPAALWL